LSIVAIAIVFGVIVVVGFVWLIYNRLVSLRLNVDNSWAQIEVALKRRHDLIPSLVGAVRGYATHERETLERVTEARGTAVADRQAGAGPGRQGRSEGALGARLGRMLIAAEAYPDLRADRNFLELGEELSDTEDQIAITRRVYNDTVQTYNTQAQVFPAVLVARAFGFRSREFFDIPDAEVDAPAIAIPAGPATGDLGGGP
jgi:LemA protein